MDTDGSKRTQTSPRCVEEAGGDSRHRGGFGRWWFGGSKGVLVTN